MTRNKAGPAAADTASGDAKHVQPSSEQADDTGKARKTKPSLDAFQQKRDAWFRAVIAHPRLRKGAPSALWFIADHASVRQDGYSWFSHATIAAGSAMSVTAVQRAIRSAEACGLLVVVSHGDSRKPPHCYPVLNGQPLAGVLPDPSEHRAKVTDVKHAASGRSDRCDAPLASGTSASNIGQNCRQHRAKVTDDLLKDLPNDPPKLVAGRKEDDDDVEDEEIKRLRDEPEARQKAERIFAELGARPETRSNMRSVARGLVILEHRRRMSFDKEIVPAIQAIARRGDGPRSGPGCKWMLSHVAAEVLLMREKTDKPGRPATGLDFGMGEGPLAEHARFLERMQAQKCPQ